MSIEKKRKAVKIQFIKPIPVKILEIEQVSSTITFGEMEVQVYESSNPNKKTIRIINQSGFLCEINREDISAIYEGDKNIWDKMYQGIQC